MNTNHHGPDSNARRSLRQDGPTSARRPRRGRGRDLLETLENRSLLTVVPMAVTLTPTPVEGVALPNPTIVATFYSPFDPNDNDFTTGTTINWGDGSAPDPNITIQPLSSAATAQGFLFAVEGSGHVYADETQGQQLPITVSIHDNVDDSFTSIVSHTSVNDAILNATGLTQPVVTAVQGTALGLTPVATFSDPNTLATGTDFTATIDWGDGSPQTTVSGTNDITQPAGPDSPFVVAGDHTYANPGPYTVTVAVKDIGGSAVNTTTTANVTASTITPGSTSGTPITINEVEGQPFTNVLVGTFTDSGTPGPISSYSATINWGTGSPTTGTIVPLGGNENGILGSFTYPEENAGASPSSPGTPYAITISVNHNGLLAATVDGFANVTDAPLSGAAVPVFATVGAPTTAVVAYFNDANPAAPLTDFTATIDWGYVDPVTHLEATSSGTVAKNGSGFVVTAADPITHLGYSFTKAGTFAYAVTIQDVGGSSLTLTQTATASAAALTATGLTVTEPIYPPINATIPLATFTDANPGAPTSEPGISQTYTATINWGDGVVSPGAVTWDPILARYDVGGTHQYTTLGTYQPIIHIADVGGATATAIATLTITDTPLTPGTEATIRGVEGRPFTAQVATFTNTNPLSKASDYSATIDWGDGTAPSGGIVKQLSDGTFTVTGSHTYAEESSNLPYLIQVSVKDAGIGGSTTMIPSAALVADAPLTSQGVPISGVEGTPLPASTVVATFTDQNPDSKLTDFSAIVNWGDGTAPLPGTIVAIGATPNGVTYAVEGTHLYTDKGNYQTTVVINDVGSSQTIAVGNAAMADAPATASPMGFAAGVDQQYSGPVAFFFQNYGAPTGLQPGGNYTATINWGDGSPPSLGTIVPVAGGYDVYGVHTYLLARTTANSNVFPVTVSIHDDGGAVVTVTSTATVLDVPVVAQLDPATDTGLSNVDGITKDAQPRFFGTGEAFGTIRLYAAPLGTSSYSPIGQASTDSSGAWSITSAKLADGKYSIVVQELDPSGNVIATQTVMPNANQGPLVIDTAGPKVTSVFLDRLHGQVDITYTDNLSGLDPAQIDNSANYTFTRLGTRPTAYQVTSISAASTAADPESEAILTINRGQPLRGGVYTLTILSGDAATGVRDVAGNALDGEFYGTFPSGNNVPGGNFVAEIDTIHNLIEAPKSVIGNASPIAAGSKPTATHIPTVNPKIAALVARQQQLQFVRQNAVTARLAAHDAALAQASAKRRG